MSGSFPRKARWGMALETALSVVLVLVAVSCSMCQSTVLDLDCSILLSA